MKFEYWFPTVTAIHYVKQLTRETTEKKIQAWIENEKHVSYIELCKEENLTTSYFKWNNTLHDLDLNELHDEIIDCSLKYSEHIGLQLERESIRIDSWINFFYPNQSEHQHNHYTNFLSGVYYVKATSESGAYRFFDPASQKVMWKSMFLNNAKTNFNNQNVGEYLPENGKLIVFPSWLEHSVLANKTNEIRISIAFNVNKVK
jgi:uncharacterized protein (TIGR02466 family)